MTLAVLPSPNFSGADLSARVNAALTELRAARRFVAVAVLLADATMAYGAGARAVALGDIVEAGGHRYRVAASAAADHDVATAGAVRLYVLPNSAGAMAAEAFGWQADNSAASATANTVAARAAIAAATLRAGGIIHFPRGIGFINGTLFLDRTTVLEGGAWLPEATSAIKLAPGSNCDMVRTRYASSSFGAQTDYTLGGGLRNIWLDGNRAAQSGTNDPVTGQLPVGINAKHWVLAELRNVEVRNCVGHGIWWGPNSNTCRIASVQSAYNGKSGLYCDNPTAGLHVSSCAFERNDEFGVEIATLDPTLSNLVFDGVSFEFNRKGEYLFANGNGGGVSIRGGHAFGMTYSGGAMTAGAASLTISGASTQKFQASDVGAAVAVPGAGTAGADLISRIAAFVSATQVTLEANAVTTTSGQTVIQGAFVTYGTGLLPFLTIQDHDHFVDRKVAVHTISGGTSTYTAYVAGMFLLYLSRGQITTPSQWATLPLTNWFGAPAGTQAVQYRKTAFGRVELRGQVSQTSGTVIATLPVGFRPPADILFPTSSFYSAAVAMLRINADGTINWVNGATTGLALSHIGFDPA